MILIDTTGLWGLVFENSKFHKFIIKTLSNKTIYVLDVQVEELFGIVYRTFSHKGKNPTQGLRKVLEIVEFLEMREFKRKGINLKIMETTIKDHFSAMRLAEQENIFWRKGPKDTVWFEYVDAVIALKWMESRALLYTRDEILIKFGTAHNLPYEIIKEAFT